MTDASKMRSRRALLFVPGTHPSRFDKAVASGADSVCIDLEDAVTLERKDEARRAAIEYLALRAAGPRPDGQPELVVRINHPDSDAGALDLKVLAEGDARPDAIMLPKVERPETVREVAEHLGGDAGTPELALLPLIESANGLHRVEEVAEASAHVAALLFGGLDLAADLGASTEWDALLYARSRLVHAAALAGVSAMDMPHPNVHDTEGLQRESTAARQLGFSGKMAIHPAQVPLVQAAFSPSGREVEWARRVVEAAEAGQENGEGVFLLDGHMVDRPVARAARATLARAAAMERSGHAPTDGDE